MTNKAGAIVGIIIGVIVVVAVLALGIYLLLKKKAKTNVKKTKDFIEFDGNNTELLKVVVVDEKMRKSNNLTVIVPPTHNALIIRNGAIVNLCSEGEFPLTENGVTIRSLKVIFVSKTAKVTVKWGTKLHQRIEYVDPKIGKPVSVGAFGFMDVRASDPRKFYLDLVANFGDVFSTEDLEDRMRTLVVDETIKSLGRVINEKKPSYVDFKSAKYDIQTQVGNYLCDKFSDEFGFGVSNFIIDSLNLLAEQEAEIKQVYAQDSAYEREKVNYERKQEIEERERLSERRRKEAIRDDKDLDDFLYERERDRLRELNEYERKNRHEDEDRAWTREDKERDFEERLHGKHLDTVKDIEISRSEAEKVKNQNSNSSESSSAINAGHHCSVCGSSFKPGAKYCPTCGAVLPREDITSKCPDCGLDIPWGTTFCPSCGHKFSK